jgi:hypothetical protein
MLVATSLTIGDPHSVPSSAIITGAPLSVASELLSTWALALVKTSIALMLLRLLQTKIWKRFLYAIVVVQTVTAVYLTIMHATRCMPLAALWDPMITNKRCWNQEAFRISLTIASVIVIATDVICALIPLTFLRKMSRPVRDRIVIGILLALGLVASAASIAKTVVIQHFGKDEDVDPISNGLAIALWAAVEEQLALIAACIPCLKAPLQRLLVRLNFTSAKETRVVLNELQHIDVGSNGVRTRTMRPNGAFTFAVANQPATTSVEQILYGEPDKESVEEL